MSEGRTENQTTRTRGSCALQHSCVLVCARVRSCAFVVAHVRVILRSCMHESALTARVLDILSHVRTVVFDTAGCAPVAFSTSVRAPARLSSCTAARTRRVCRRALSADNKNCATCALRHAKQLGNCTPKWPYLSVKKKVLPAFTGDTFLN